MITLANSAILKDVGGLTKREYFAALAMLGHFSLNARFISYPEAMDFAKGAVIMADALIEELNRKPENSVQSAVENFSKRTKGIAE